MTWRELRDDPAQRARVKLNFVAFAYRLARAYGAATIFAPDPAYYILRGEAVPDGPRYCIDSFLPKPRTRSRSS